MAPAAFIKPMQTKPGPRLLPSQQRRFKRHFDPTASLRSPFVIASDSQTVHAPTEAFLAEAAQEFDTDVSLAPQNLPLDYTLSFDPAEFSIPREDLDALRNHAKLTVAQPQKPIDVVQSPEQEQWAFEPIEGKHQMSELDARDLSYWTVDDDDRITEYIKSLGLSDAPPSYAKPTIASRHRAESIRSPPGAPKLGYKEFSPRKTRSRTVAASRHGSDMSVSSSMDFDDFKLDFELDENEKRLLAQTQADMKDWQGLHVVS